MKHPRVAISSLFLSAATLVGIALHEGYSPKAYLPTPNDVLTVGFGSTKGVKAGDTITPERALVRLLEDAGTFEQAVKRCAPVPMHPHEFSAFVSLTYNIGPGKNGVKDGFCELKRGGPSTIVIRLLAGDYKGACEAILMWDKQAGKTLRGLTIRRKAERDQCLGLKP